MAKSERSRREASFPKCQHPNCGNTIGLASLNRGSVYCSRHEPEKIPYMTQASHEICDLLRLDGFTEDQSMDFIKMLTALEKRKFNLYKEN